MRVATCKESWDTRMYRHIEGDEVQFVCVCERDAGCFSKKRKGEGGGPRGAALVFREAEHATTHIHTSRN